MKWVFHKVFTYAFYFIIRAQYEAPQSLRAKFGLTDTRNATHGSGEYFFSPSIVFLRFDKVYVMVFFISYHLITETFH